MKTFTIVRGLFDTRKRSLLISENFIKFENKDLKDNSFTTFNKEDIAGIRYGIHFIKGLEFYIGREYQIFIRNKENKELKVFFKLFYARKLNEKHQLYCDIVDELWKNFFGEISHNYFEKFKNNEAFNIANVHIFGNKITFDKQEILFEDLGIKRYNHHFIIYSKEDHYKNKMLYYLKDKDAVILLNLLSQITHYE